MKNLSLLITVCFCLSGCGKRKAPVADVDPTESLVRSISETGHVAFESWNGKLTGLDCDSLLHFYADSKVVLEDRGLGVDHYEGSYDLRPNGRVAVTLKKYREDWPLLILRREGSDLLLYREDGHTSWLPKDYPDPDPQVEGFWPFRAKTESTAPQGVADRPSPAALSAEPSVD